MQILCAISGLSFVCEHFPGQFHTRESVHPIFLLEQKKLISYMGKWSSGGLTPTDSYLLMLALLRSTELVDFRVPAWRTASTESIVSLSMEPLVRVLIKMNTISDVHSVFSRYAITPDTKDLSNLPDWIDNWMDCYKEHQDNYRHHLENRKLISREAALERLIKSPQKPISSYATQIAEWAAAAGKFPSGLTLSPKTGLQIPLSDYWKGLIVKCAKQEGLYGIPRADLTELLEHCECEIPLGSIFSQMLFDVLRKGIEKQKNFLGFGDLDLSSTTYVMLSDSGNTEDANMKILIDSAPEEEPRKEQYPSKIAYIRARMKWDMKKKLGSSLEHLAPPAPFKEPREQKDGFELLSPATIGKNMKAIKDMNHDDF
jgi:hypothetical protein